MQHRSLAPSAAPQLRGPVRSVPLCPVRHSASGARQTIIAGATKRKAAYVVVIGRQTGIFYEWELVKSLVQGVSGNIYQGFSSKAEAQAYWEDKKSQSKATEPNTNPRGGMATLGLDKVPITTEFTDIGTPPLPEPKIKPSATYTVECVGIKRQDPLSIGIAALLYDADEKLVDFATESSSEDMSDTVIAYKAALAGLKLATSVGVEKVVLRTTCRLLADQVEGSKSTGPATTALYSKLMDQAKGFNGFGVEVANTGDAEQSEEFAGFAALIYAKARQWREEQMAAHGDKDTTRLFLSTMAQWVMDPKQVSADNIVMVPRFIEKINALFSALRLRPGTFNHAVAENILLNALPDPTKGGNAGYDAEEEEEEEEEQVPAAGAGTSGVHAAAKDVRTERAEDGSVTFKFTE